MSTSEAVTDGQFDEIAETLGTPDFSDFADDSNPSPDITEAIMSDEQPSQSVAVGAGDMVVVTTKFITSYLAARRGEHWALTKDEAIELKNAVDAVAPDMQMSPGWTLGAVVVGITAPRILTDVQVQRALEEAEQEGSDDAQTPAT
ncbi:hypothetical protein [Pseudoalteromonas rubra]|uniref:hypothetical protein n=1 Tax=Pseudoalteromonas rubra TaxID=43658 RepID=UPI002DBEFCBD|nr:hypothetical protein [Pseudoalteromonas rubra]MEC4091143.1 hypothetical protein [Pseudoalteromonas rubra]